MENRPAKGNIKGASGLPNARLLPRGDDADGSIARRYASDRISCTILSDKKITSCRMAEES